MRPIVQGGVSRSGKNMQKYSILARPETHQPGPANESPYAIKEASVSGCVLVAVLRQTPGPQEALRCRITFPGAFPCRFGIVELPRWRTARTQSVTRATETRQRNAAIAARSCAIATASVASFARKPSVRFVWRFTNPRITKKDPYLRTPGIENRLRRENPYARLRRPGAGGRPPNQRLYSRENEAGIPIRTSRMMVHRRAINKRSVTGVLWRQQY
jgi:hypothetical protein